MERERTRFAGLSQDAAAAVLAVTVLLLAWGLGTSRKVGHWASGNAAFADLYLFRELVERVHGGEGYYDVHEDVFRRVQVETRSMFNWRQPTFAWMLGALPDPALGRWLLLGLAFVSVVAAATTLLPRGPGLIGVIVGGIGLLGGAFAWGIYEPEAYLTTEVWCDALMLLSLSAYATGRWRAGMAAALAALAMRELALPYCLVAAALAAWRGRRTELIAWGVALAVYAGLLYLHGAAVARRNPGLEAAAVDDWMNPGGLRFVLRVGAMNVYLRWLPPWVLAVTLTLALVGLAGWRGEAGTRAALTAGVYIVAFMFVFGNEYWGSHLTPLLVIGMVRSPAALYDLGRAAILPRPDPDDPEP